MKKLIILLIVLLIGTYSTALAFDGEDALIKALIKGKQINSKSDGLGYTQDDSDILKTAYKALLATNKDYPTCEVMKTSVDLKYNPYEVLVNLYAADRKIDIDQLCMCATEAGISKSLITQAAVNGIKDQRDEIPQSQCLQEGLGYTPSTTLPNFKARPQQPVYSSSIPR